MTEPPPTEFILVRHGETVWNAEGRLQGHLDSDLTPLGRQQAEAIGRRFEGQPIDALYSSDLGRALHTAEQIAARTGLGITADARLRERNLGIFQTLTWAEVRQRYPSQYHLYESDPDYVIPEGESAIQRFHRTCEGAVEIAARHPGGRVVVVAHGGVLDTLLRHTLGIAPGSPRRWKLWNASVNTFFVRDSTWTLGTWGDIQHLRGLGTSDDW